MANHRPWMIGACILLSASMAARAQDALDEALSAADLTRADLGWRPKGWWPRFPADIPYKLRAFDDLFAAPLDTIPYVRALGESVRVHLAPETLDARLDRGTSNLYQLVHALGVNPKFGGLRGYAPNLPTTELSLDAAILSLHEAAGRPTTFVTFGTESPYPKLREDLAQAVGVIPEEVRPILAQLVVRLIDAHRWADLAFRNVPIGQRMVVSRRFNLGEEQVDALDYCPEVDDIARAWDEASLWYAGEKCVQALDDARVALKALPAAPAFRFDHETPWGWIRILGSGGDEVDAAGSLLIVDLGGDDVYRGAAAASSAEYPIALLLDLSGNDRYMGDGPAQGAGVCGVGVLVDAAGDDEYVGGRLVQGLGQFGIGVCADLGGNDRYFARYSGQGCGFFGIGLLLDADGDDRYTLYADGQGLGGVGGVGVLADRRGHDTYTAVRDARVTGRPSYHSPGENVTVSNAQGCAMGRRGDGADGHSWAGGLGALLDTEGNDKYTSGNWAMGTGYWFGAGVLHDGGGDDEYDGAVYTMATGAHFCIGALIDESGSDRYVAGANSNMSIAWGHDFTIALLLDAAGGDHYELNGDGLSCSINRSVTMLADLGGDDVYVGREGSRPGTARFDERFRPREIGSYWADAISAALFLDVGGRDRYPAGTAETQAMTDDTVRLDAPQDPNVLARNLSIAVDRAVGAVRFDPVPSRGSRRALEPK
jgi:hypothetical protein